MATTTNYSWATPYDTDLVKDGAAAIRTLGSSADTTVKNLNPGTTAGDVDYYTSGTAKARIGIGTAGQILTVNAGATAPEWAAPAPGGGLTLLSTTTINSGTTSQTISSISTAYTQLLIVMKNIKQATSNASWTARLNSDTGSNYMSGYVGASFAGTQSASTLRTDMFFGSRNSSSATWNKQGYGQLRLIDYNAVGYCQVDYDVINHDGGGGNDTLWYTHAKVIYNATSAVTSFTLIADTNFSSGTVLIYGVN